MRVAPIRSTATDIVCIFTVIVRWLSATSTLYVGQNLHLFLPVLNNSTAPDKASDESCANDRQYCTE